jgi:hypothetical protein
MSKPKPIKIVQEDSNPVAVEVIATHIIAIAESIARLRAGRLTDRALFLLIQAAAPNYRKPLSLKEIKSVFDGIDALKTEFIKKPK